MDHETRSNSQSNGSELQDGIDSVLKNVEYLSLALPTWIELRINTMDFFVVSPKSDSSPASSRLRDYFLPALTNSISIPSALRSELAITVASAAASAATLGLFRGYKSAKAEIDQRRFSSAVDYLRRDMPESSYLQTILKDLMQAFFTVKKFPVDGLVDEKAGSNYAGNFSDDYDDYFMEWCENFGTLLNTFSSILSQSMRPWQLIGVHSSQNSKNCLNENHILHWVRCLEDLMPAIIELRQRAGKIVKSLNDQVRWILINKTIEDEAASKTPDTSMRDKPDNRISLDDDWCMVDNQINNEADRNLPAMDQWFQMVHCLFANSIRVASEISSLLSEENLPPLLAKAYALDRMKAAKNKVTAAAAPTHPQQNPDPNLTSRKTAGSGSQ